MLLFITSLKILNYNISAIFDQPNNLPNPHPIPAMAAPKINVYRPDFQGFRPIIAAFA
jgi:hypothetical protein